MSCSRSRRRTASSPWRRDWVIACDGANSDTRRMVGREVHRAVLPGPLPDRRRRDEGRLSRPSAGSGSIRRSIATSRRCCTSRPTTSGGSTSSSAGTPIRRRRRSPRRSSRGCARCSATTREFELEWVSIYQFACRRIDNFRYGRVLFAGDAAHQVSPFGARGANTGVQDIDNLGWKLKLVIDGDAPLALIDSYNEERAFAADDNLLNSTRSTDFITPKSPTSRRFRDAVLELAEDNAFARPLVNSGRLSTPTPYVHSSLNTPDDDAVQGADGAGHQLRRRAGLHRRPARLVPQHARRRFRGAGLRRRAGARRDLRSARSRRGWSSSAAT